MNRTHLSLHLSDDQLVAHLYGIADEAAEPHLNACEECQLRWAEIQLRRHSSLTTPEPAEDLFVRQRQAVLANAVRHTTPLRSTWLPAGAAVLAIAAILMFRPTQPAQTIPPVAAVSDSAPALEAGWFDEAYASSASVEPRAAQPLRELFASAEQVP